MPAPFLPVLVLAGAVVQPAVHVKQQPVANKLTYGTISEFRESPGGRVFAVYAGPLGTVPQKQLQQANGFQKERPQGYFVPVNAPAKK